MQRPRHWRPSSPTCVTMSTMTIAQQREASDLRAIRLIHSWHTPRSCRASHPPPRAGRAQQRGPAVLVSRFDRRRTRKPAPRRQHTSMVLLSLPVRIAATAVGDCSRRRPMSTAVTGAAREHAQRTRRRRATSTSLRGSTFDVDRE
ncbi:hypothetical protein EXIGLDRAFT_474099 [Exidia glandulosa HHB12029]|uniref:Uncharacterized protein n=1 Tax=Exidia glandulosa HHB12029 TaxID=1314781 RepID=A0A165ARH1_EXIGL|nr:hypothetical protein EXIGLDRAFT_474099 [Exidia glandulosa HHB12029]